MIALDTNILVYAHRKEYPQHKVARKIVLSLMNGTNHWAIPWPCLHEFIAVVTNARIFKKASSIKEVEKVFDILLSSSKLNLLSEEENHLKILLDLITQGSISGGMVHDARIAAICLSNGVSELWSADRDFSRFPKLTVSNPLISQESIRYTP